VAGSDERGHTPQEETPAKPGVTLRLALMERPMCLARVHVVVVPAESVHDTELVARTMVDRGIRPSQHDLGVFDQNTLAIMLI
jgi:hypothetical protein